MAKFCRADCRSVLLFAALACLGCANEPAPDAVPDAVPDTVDVTLVELPAEEVGFKLVGVGTCTASGCHGGGKPEQIVGSEYNIWIADDPHARAHSVLYDDRSLRIVQLLDGSAWDPSKPAYEDMRCLSCHSTTFALARNQAGEVLTDGVGCEACHGPAEGWLSEHHLDGFDAAAKQRLGFWDTDDLFTRAQICAGCHVGGPGREVNHDLIAAGHPRLQFEMGAYLQALPKHWDELRDQTSHNGNFSLLTWLTGQAASSQSALRQLESRATEGKCWPEFSEWSCSACHHDLRDAVSLQQKLARDGGLSGRSIRWDDWNHHLTGQYAEMISATLGGDQGAAGKIETGLAQLAQLMGSPSADRTAVAAAAHALGSEIETWARQVEHADIDPRAVDQLSRRIVDHALTEGVEDWSQASLVYDALVSLHQTRLDSTAEPSAIDEQVTAALNGVYDVLSQRYRQPANYVFQAQEMKARLQELSQLYDRRSGR